MWRNDGEENKRWRCNKYKKTISARRYSLFHKSALVLRTIVLFVCYWLGGATIAETSAATGCPPKTITAFGRKMKNFCREYMKLYPHIFNRNPIAVEKVGECKLGCKVFVMTWSGGDTIMLHDKVSGGRCRFTQRKHLPLLPNTSFVFTDTYTYMLPNGCQHSPLATCTFNKEEKVEAGRLFFLSKRVGIFRKLG